MSKAMTSGGNITSDGLITTPYGVMTIQEYAEIFVIAEPSHDHSLGLGSVLKNAKPSRHKSSVDILHGAELAAGYAVNGVSS